MLNSKPVFLILMAILCFYGCIFNDVIEKTDDAFEIIEQEATKILGTKAILEVLDSGFVWTEGPLWLESTNQLIFNDIPANTTYSWSEKEGKKVYLSPSGYTDVNARGGEPGANGLLLDHDGKLVLCQHGDRRMAKMTAALNSPASAFSTIVDNLDGKKFNSPNDATISKSGNLYFTDPPYGLSSPELQEINFNGVYRYSVDGQLSIIDSTLTRPNGIAFSPDEKALYVANSDPQHAVWYKYSIDEATGKVLKKEVFHDATEHAKTEKGLPDGLKVNDDGYIFATGPGGVWIFNPDGKVLAKIRTGQATSNCAFGKTQKTLFITADDYIMRASF